METSYLMGVRMVWGRGGGKENTAPSREHLGGPKQGSPLLWVSIFSRSLWASSGQPALPTHLS